MRFIGNHLFVFLFIALICIGAPLTYIYIHAQDALSKPQVEAAGYKSTT